jgi:hypothetical protein
MELQEIDVFIEKDGQVKIEIRGVKGMSCLDLTKDLEAVLGNQIVAREMTSEANEMGQEQIQEEQQWQWG